MFLCVNLCFDLVEYFRFFDYVNARMSNLGGEIFEGFVNSIDTESFENNSVSR